MLFRYINVYDGMYYYTYSSGISCLKPAALMDMLGNNLAVRFIRQYSAQRNYDIKIFNPIEAGVFWNHTGWGGGGGHCAPLCFSFIYGPITTKLSMMVLWEQNLSNAIKFYRLGLQDYRITEKLLKQ